ncbi:MAG: hypothetical protein ACRC35_08515 [Angustibacter sp.]
MTPSRAQRATAVAAWAATVDQRDLKPADARALRTIGQLVDRRDRLDEEIAAAVGAARQANRSWSQIGAALGVSKQAAQRRYGPHPSA